QISNREPIDPFRRNCFAFTGRSPRAMSRGLATRHSPRVTAFLIVTPRIELTATLTKQSLSPNSNRYKSGSFYPPRKRLSHPRFVSGKAIFLFASLCRGCAGTREALRHSLLRRPSGGATLTLPHPPSNLLSSCSVRAFAGVHSRLNSSHGH